MKDCSRYTVYVPCVTRFFTEEPHLRHFLTLEEHSSQATLCPQGSNVTFSSPSSEQTQHSTGGGAGCLIPLLDDGESRTGTSRHG